MIRTNNRSHAGTLERFRIALDKAESNPEISRALIKVSYGPEVLREGNDILESTWEIFDENLRIKDELSSARTNFSKYKAEMDSRFREHRKKAMLIFRNDPVAVNKLGIKRKYPTKYSDWIEYMRAFYKAIVENAEIQQSLQRLNFTKEEALEEQENLKKLGALYANSIYYKGVSQNSTKQKNKAFAKLTDWMSVFYGAARLALKKEPELLEALYKSA